MPTTTILLQTNHIQPHTLHRVQSVSHHPSPLMLLKRCKTYRSTTATLSLWFVLSQYQTYKYRHTVLELLAFGLVIKLCFYSSILHTLIKMWQDISCWSPVQERSPKTLTSSTSSQPSHEIYLKMLSIISMMYFSQDCFTCWPTKP